MFNHVLVPLDGSDLAEKALPYARTILGSGGKLTLMSIIDVPHVAFPVSPSLPLLKQEIAHYQMNPQARSSKAEIYLRRTADGLKDSNVQIDTHIEVSEDAASAIIETCKALSVEALVMATHGHSGLDRWLMGSVTQKVLQAASFPIFVIPARVK